MATITTTDVVNGTATDAGVVNGNFAAVKAVVNGGLSNDNVSASANIAVTKIAPSSTDNDVLTTVSGVPTWQAPVSGGGGGGSASPATPVGGGMDFWGAAAPTGWLFADGSAISRTTYALLFSQLGTAYGAGDGTTTFNLPDKRGRTSVAKGTHSDVDALGENDGVVVANRRPKHRHTQHQHGIPYRTYSGDPGNIAGALAGVNAPNFGGATYHADGGSGNANDPLDAPAWIVCNYIIYAGV